MNYEFDIRQQLELRLNKVNVSNDNYQEVYKNDLRDGNVFKEFMKTAKSGVDDVVVSFTLNTCGVSLCDKSLKTTWPIYLIINKIPINSRFRFENVIIAGRSIS